MKIIFTAICLCLITASGVFSKQVNATTVLVTEPDPQEIYIKNKAEINEFKKKHGKSLYVGEGVAEIKKDIDLGEAIRISKERAIVDLLKSIKVRIQLNIRDELKYTEGGTVSGEFERVIKSYVNQVLEIVQETRYDDFPKHGMVTSIVYVDRADYDEKVARDMQIKTDRIKSFAIAGTKAQSARDIGQAIENYIKGKIWLKNDFNDLPVKASIQDGGAPEDLGAYFDTRLTQIFHSIKIQALDDKVFYNTEGKVSKKPIVRVTYKDSAGETPLADMPVKASFSKGSGTISSVTTRTGRNGEVYIPLEYVDPGEREAAVQVELDAASLQLKESQILPVIFIPVSKSKAVAWAVSFFKGGKRETPSSLANSVKMALVNAGYEIKSLTITNQEITDNTISAARELNVDYIVYVCVVSSVLKDEYGMYKSVASSRVYIYSLYDGRLIEIIEGQHKSGYSVSASGSAYTALGKLTPGLMDSLKEKIKTLK